MKRPDITAVITYRRFYETADIPNLREVLERIPKAYFILFLIPACISFKAQREAEELVKFIKLIYDDRDVAQKEKLIERATSIMHERGEAYTAFSVYAALWLLGERFKFDDSQSETSVDSCREDFFKSFLIFNELNINDIHSDIRYIDKNYPYFGYHLYPLVNLLRYGQYQASQFYSAFSCEFAKAICFIAFLEQSVPLKTSYQSLLNYYRIAGGRIYLAAMYKLYDTAKDADIPKYISLGETPLEMQALIKRFVFDLDTKQSNNKNLEFILNHPYLDFGDGIAILLYPGILVDKVYRGLYFDLKPHYPGQDLREIITKRFSEEFLFNNVLNFCFKDYSIKFESVFFDNQRDTQIHRFTDYYLREENIYFLFENKDNLFPADIKDDLGKNFQDIERHLQSNFLKDKGGAPKGIKQLIACIDKIEQGKHLRFDTTAPQNNEKKVIYPIIVFHDNAYDSPGIGLLIKDWFEKEVSVKQYQTLEVKPITFVSINCLIKISDLLNTREVGLIEYLNFLATQEQPSDRDESRTGVVGDVLLRIQPSFVLTHKFIHAKTGGDSVPVGLMQKLYSLLE